MTAAAVKPPSPRQKLGVELWHGLKGIVLGASLAYAGVYLYHLVYPAAPQATVIELHTNPAAAKIAAQVSAPAAQPGEDPWWRGDAQFWREQARLNSAAVAPQYREIQVAWAEMMAATAEKKAQSASGIEPLAVPAKQAKTTELQIPTPAQP